MKAATRSEIFLFAATCCASLMMADRASSATFFTDSFNYADGDLTVVGGSGNNVSGGLWVPHSGQANPPSIKVEGGKAKLLNSGSEDANRSAGTLIAAGSTWYYSALVTVLDDRADPLVEAVRNEYFLHFKDAGTSNFRGRAYLSSPNAADPTKFTFGLSATSGGQAAKWSQDLEFGKPYTLVVSYAVDTGATSLWVDPVNAASPKITDVNGAAAFTQVNSLALRQAFISPTPGVRNNVILVDAVALGDNFDEVLRGVAIPEPTAGLLLALAGVAAVARRNRCRIA